MYLQVTSITYELNCNQKAFRMYSAEKSIPKEDAIY